MIQIATYNKAWKLNGVPRRYSTGTAALIKETATAMYAIFQQQKRETQRYLNEAGVHDWMYEDAQKRIAKDEEKTKRQGEVTISKLTIPYSEIDKQLEGWWDAAQKSRDKMAKKLQEQNAKAANMAGQAALDMLALDANFYLQDKQLKGKLLTRGTKITGVVTQNTLNQFRGRLVKHYYYQGEDPRTVKKAINGLFEETYKNRAWTIARTETGYAQNLTTYESYKKNGVRRKRWLASMDDLTRNTHVMSASQGPINIDERFINGLLHPHEEGAPAGEVINCRCRPGAVILPSDEKPTKAQIWHGQEAERRKDRTKPRASVTSMPDPKTLPGTPATNAAREYGKVTGKFGSDERLMSRLEARGLGKNTKERVNLYRDNIQKRFGIETKGIAAGSRSLSKPMKEEKLLRGMRDTRTSIGQFQSKTGTKVSNYTKEITFANRAAVTKALPKGTAGRATSFYTPATKTISQTSQNFMTTGSKNKAHAGIPIKTAQHEMSHGLYPTIDSSKQASWDNVRSANPSEFITDYASTDKYEDFSESVAHSIREPEKMKSLAPNKHKWIQENILL